VWKKKEWHFPLASHKEKGLVGASMFFVDKIYSTKVFGCGNLIFDCDDLVLLGFQCTKIIWHNQKFWLSIHQRNNWLLHKILSPCDIALLWPILMPLVSQRGI